MFIFNSFRPNKKLQSVFCLFVLPKQSKKKRKEKEYKAQVQAMPTLPLVEESESVKEY